jgi:hypothetical protein
MPKGKYSRLEPQERFWNKVDKCGPIPEFRPDLGQCWIWVGAIQSNGYGTWAEHLHGRQTSAHRFSWEWENGKIPDGLVPDHLCRVRRCVRQLT